MYIKLILKYKPYINVTIIIFINTFIKQKMKTSPLVLLALVGSASAQATPADQLATQIVGLEKALEWSGELALGSVEKVIEIRKFLKDLT